jgi:hypothetical protein
MMWGSEGKTVKLPVAWMLVLSTTNSADAKPKAKADPPDASVPAPTDRPDAGPPLEDALTRAAARAVVMHRLGDDANALRALMEAVDEARARAPLNVHEGAILKDYPENIGIYEPAPGSMAFGNSIILYVEVDNHGFRRRSEGFELDLWTDVFLCYDDGERIGGKERFGVHRLTSHVPYRSTHMVMEVNVNSLPAQKYQAHVIVHDAVSGKVGETRIPFRVAARPGQAR